ncbi:MAG: (Fe-S)-binding protein [Dehalococcoidia bacterium]|nr:(Fe-S)-binding protein [Dehalococcoidia bacterium]
MARVALFDPCYLGALRPTDAFHAKRVLEALGDEVTLIDGRCCGQPAYNSGFRGEAKRVSLSLLREARHHDVVVTASGSCTSMVTHFVPGLFEGTKREGAARIAGRFREFTAYVAGHPNLDRLALMLEGTVVYHDSCHMRNELGGTDTVLGLLAKVELLEVRRLAHEAECCGFGGAFTVKLPEVAAVMMTAKLDDIAASGAKVVVSADFSCLAHLESGARGTGQRMETWTVAELLARALG